jgi:hypothetical protein
MSGRSELAKEMTKLMDSIRQIQDSLGLSPEEVEALRRNFREPPEVTELNRQVAAGRPLASMIPEMMRTNQAFADELNHMLGLLDRSFTPEQRRRAEVEARKRR